MLNEERDATTESHDEVGLLKPEDHDNSVEHPIDDDPSQPSEIDVDHAVDTMTEDSEEPVDQDSSTKDEQPQHSDKPHTLKEKIVHLYHAWWNNTKLRYATLGVAGILVVLIGLVPASRYFVLNTVGVRAKASIVVFDDASDLPLKNVQVTLGNQSAKTDAKGKVNLAHLKLGRQQLVIKKRAFADVSKTVTLGWGSNPLGNSTLRPIGAQYSLYVTDWLSGKPVAGAEASSGEYDAVADKEGKLVLTIDASADDNLNVKVQSKDYRTETIALDLNTKSKVDVKLVPSRKHIFVSKRSGKYDLFKIDVDGQNEQLVLAGTGNENEAMTILPHPTSELTAFVSTRGNTRNADGYLMNTLNIIDLSDNDVQSVVQSEDIRLLGWSGDKLVFIQVVAGASAPNDKRQRLVVYDSKTAQKIELATSNNFNDALLVGTTIYYAPGNVYNSSVTNHFYSQRIDGSNKKALLDGEVWTAFRTTYDKLALSGDQMWYDYSLGDTKAYRRAGAPSNLQDVSYFDNRDVSATLWVEERDGKNTLLLSQASGGDDKILKAQAGLQAPLRWLNDQTVIYRVQTPGESADYALSTQGGEAKKIRDVTRTGGIWQ